MEESEFVEAFKDLESLESEEKNEMVRHFKKIFKGREDFVVYVAKWANKKGIVFLPTKEPDIPRIMLDMGGHGGLDFFMRTCEKLNVSMVLVFADRKGATLLGFVRGGFLFAFDVLST